jgi:orotidine-5'-phosphate decarboxylase
VAERGETAGHFADRLIQGVRKHGHPLCLGLDPHLDRIPELFRRGAMEPRDPATADAVEAFLAAVLERAAPRVAVVKPQIACFEQLGWPGLRALARVVERARAQGLLVLLDAKRADIASTAEAYARAYLEPQSALAVDAITANPYLGNDSLAPFVERARRHGRGVFVLVATSNPGSADLQGLRLEDGKTVAEAVAASLRERCEALAGPATGWSSLGAVVGATQPQSAERIRAALPRALFLVPGFGEQGASAREAVRGFVPGPGGLEGGIVNAARSVLFGEREGGAADAGQWEQGFDARLARTIEALAEAVRS